MKEEHFHLTGLDGHRFACTVWRPEPVAPEIKATIQIAHGMGEHRRRYKGLAEALTHQGYAVFASDHRGHGDTQDADNPGAMGRNGWRQTLADMNYLAECAHSQHPGKPAILLGHSMGAALSQQYISLYGDTLNGVVLSGSPGFMPTPNLFVGELLARLEGLRIGPDTPSELLQRMLFGKNNEAFANQDTSGPAPVLTADEITGYEWLSKDQVEVDAYVADPNCGFVLTPRSLGDMFRGMRQAKSVDAVLAIPKSLPIYVFSGADDPVHADESGLNALQSCYTSVGLKVEYKLYPEGRHEMLNETNRVDVVADLIHWLEATLAPD